MICVGVGGYLVEKGYKLKPGGTDNLMLFSVSFPGTWITGPENVEKNVSKKSPCWFFSKVHIKTI